MIIDFSEPVYSYNRFIMDAKNLAQQYHTILDCVTIGSSHDNRDIVLLKLGLGQKTMVITAGVHGRESINPIVVLAIVEYYADMYMNSRQQRLNFRRKLEKLTAVKKREYEQMLYSSLICELLQTFTILFVPLLNPDGYMISLEGFPAVRNELLREKCLSHSIPHEEWKYNARGIDINRNFPSRLWKPAFENDRAASENETKALIYLFHEFKSRGFLDFHSRGKSIYYYRSMMPDSYNIKQLEIANRLKKITNYKLEPPQNEVETGDTGGNTVHYYSEHFHRPALTLETVDETADFPLKQEYRVPTFEELKLVIFEFGSLII